MAETTRRWHMRRGFPVRPHTMRYRGRTPFPSEPGEFADLTDVNLYAKTGSMKLPTRYDEFMYEQMMLGADEELGDAQDFGAYALLTDVHIPGTTKTVHAIVEENNSGTVDIAEFPSAAAAKRQWRTLEADYADFLRESE